MTKTVIWGTIVLAVTITAGIFAFIPIQEASSAAGGNPSQLVRDNIVVTGLTTSLTTAGGPTVGAIVLIDNFGIGGTSDVEVTWTKGFPSDTDCALVHVGGTQTAASPGMTAGFPILGNDGALSGAPGVTSVAHTDVTGTDAILLVDTTDDGSGCSLGSDFISISTVASSP